jgi:hypothetical protein
MDRLIVQGLALIVRGMLERHHPDIWSAPTRAELEEFVGAADAVLSQKPARAKAPV